MASTLFVNILSSRSLADPLDARTILELLCATGDQLRPESYGASAWPDRRFDCGDMERPLADRTAAFWWERQDPVAHGTISVPSPKYAPQHGRVEAQMEAARADIGRLVPFLLTACNRLEADFGCIHMPVRDDWRGYDRPGLSDGVGRDLNVSTSVLETCIPDLPWGTVFGPPYVELFGRNRLLTAPASLVRELEYGGVYVQLLDFIIAPVPPPSTVLPEERYAYELEYARSAVKGHLGSDAFFDPYLPPLHDYSVPRFRLPDVEQEAFALKGAPTATSGLLAELLKPVLDTAEVQARAWKLAKDPPVEIPVQVPVRCQQRIRAITWLCRSGEPWAGKLTIPARQIGSWDEAQAARRSIGKATDRASSCLSEWVAKNYTKEFNKRWNPLAALARSFIERTVMRSIWSYADAKGLSSDVPKSARGDLIHYILEEAYDPLQHPCRFFRELMKVYEAGHFPCGWEGGEWPEGRLLVY